MRENQLEIILFEKIQLELKTIKVSLILRQLRRDCFKLFKVLPQMAYKPRMWFLHYLVVIETNELQFYSPESPEKNTQNLTGGEKKRSFYEWNFLPARRNVKREEKIMKMLQT